MNDPEVRIGLARMINLLKSLASQPGPSINEVIKIYNF
jgi:hypothetical protein